MVSKEFLDVGDRSVAVPAIIPAARSALLLEMAVRLQFVF